MDLEDNLQELGYDQDVLLYQLWKHILIHLSINIDNYQYNFQNNELINDWWYNPFTSKMIKDLDIKFTTTVDDNFYIERYNNYSAAVNSAGDTDTHI